MYNNYYSNGATLLSTTLPSILQTPAFKALYAELNTNNAQTLLVGGCVRDILQGVNITDIDLATTLVPTQVIDILTKAGFATHPTGITHGTILAVKDKQHFEITTLRRDVSTDGRHATVAFTTDFKEDAARRDFTFNAMYMDIKGNITDYYNGLGDLKDGIVRFVGAPTQRLEEDWLRGLRYFRFYARFGKKKPDAETISALKYAAKQMNTLSAERKTSEFLKILETAKATEAIKMMTNMGYLEQLGLTRFKHQQLIAFMERFPNKTDGLTRLIAAVWSAKNPYALQNKIIYNKDFTFSNKQKNLMRKLATYNARDLQRNNPAYSRWKLGEEEANLLFCLTEITSHSHTLEKVKDDKPPLCPINGDDIIAMGISSGKDIGQILKPIQKWWAWNGFPSKEDCIQEIKNRLNKPNTVLIIPDIHGNIDGLNSLLSTSLAKEASVIISLGDYLDCSEDTPQQTTLVKTADAISSLLENDERFILLRANHEQINSLHMNKALKNGFRIHDSIKINKHNLLLMKELEQLSDDDCREFAARVIDTYLQKSIDAVRIKLTSGKILAFTHAGWHVSIPDKDSAFDYICVGDHKVEMLSLPMDKMPKYARSETVWGHWLSCPEHQQIADAKHLHQPPQNVTLVVGHHYSRRKNTMPEQTDNIIFTDTGSGKGGQLTALLITLDTETIETLLPADDGSFVLSPLSITPDIVPFERNIHNLEDLV